jgi:hypothetical protein
MSKFQFLAGAKIFLFAIKFILALVPTQLSFQWVPMAFSQAIKQLDLEGNHSPLFSVKVNVWSYTATAPYIFMAWCLIIKDITNE